ncbi:hypothetical protein M6B38_393950 [Iris pallida]|uniref:Uncharacterized protein n=1 Tax=Iris pallida TaxID=29817 RepID=A0AAX6FWT5_IRIPA|nr:hypothetical protein M6B38_393950 [Iris pallida]
MRKKEIKETHFGLVAVLTTTTIGDGEIRSDLTRRGGRRAAVDGFRRTVAQIWWWTGLQRRRPPRRI